MYNPWDPNGRIEFQKQLWARTHQWNNEFHNNMAASRAAERQVAVDPFPGSSSGSGNGGSSYTARRTGHGKLFGLGLGMFALGVMLLQLL